MQYDFLDRFKDIEVGQKIRIRTACIYHPRRYKSMPVHSDFIQFIKTRSNKFTVDTIQEYDDDAVLITVEEVAGTLEYEQVEPIGQRRSKVFNWHKRTP